MHKRDRVIEIERFMDIKYVKKDVFVTFFFIILLLMIGLIEKNLILPNNGLGLLRHINSWLLFGMNIMIPIVINRLFITLENSITQNTLNKIRVAFKKNAEHRSITVLSHFFMMIGFCCFIGNSLQNANIINQLPFDYWDSIHYVISYIVSRFYKFYLFVYFIPLVLAYAFILIKSISELLIISEEEMKEYPIKNYEQLNILCNFGLNILLTLLLPLILSSGIVYFIHNRFDITSTTTIIISIISALVSIIMYMLLIKKFYVSVIKYKKENINQINQELSEIHQYILGAPFNEQNSEKLEVYLKKEKYLCQIKERIEKISKFPLVFKAIFTSVTPLLPTLLKLIFQFLNTFFKLGILAIIL